MAKNPESQDPSPPADDPSDMPKLSTRLSVDLKRRLKIAAAVHGRTESSIVIEAIEEWLRKHPTS